MKRVGLTGAVPWVMSGLLHAGFALFGCLVVWSSASGGGVGEVIVPNIRLSKTSATGVELPATLPERPQVAEQKSVSVPAAATVATDVSGQEQKVELDASLMKLGDVMPRISPFASGRSSQEGGGNVRRLVFVVDASGSLVDCWPAVVGELGQMIEQLNAQQRFTLILFQGKRVIEAPPAGLKRADAKTRKHVVEWMDPRAGAVVPGGRTSPLGAIERGLGYQPQLMVILSDNIGGPGWTAADADQMLADIRRSNVYGTVISTIQFFHIGAAEVTGSGILERLATEHGGTYQLIDGRTVTSWP